MYMHMYMLYCICADAHTFASRGGRGVAAVARCGVGASPLSGRGTICIHTITGSLKSTLTRLNCRSCRRVAPRAARSLDQHPLSCCLVVHPLHRISCQHAHSYDHRLTCSPRARLSRRNRNSRCQSAR